MKMWLDDIRSPITYGHIGWVWVKTYDEAIALLKTDKVLEASLDHDLTIQQTLGYKDKEKTGYDVVCWMEENNKFPSEGCKVHSMNPAGKKKMEQAIYKYYNKGK